MMNEALLIPITAIAMPMVVVPTIMVMKLRIRRRELEHIERMKALEMGQPVPGSQAWPALAAISIGAGVPIGAFFVTWLASMTGHASGDIWLAPIIVGLAAVISGASLGTKLFGRKPSANAPGPAAVANGKPVFDPDAFDVVSRRG
jgi:hypothetical protein